MNPNNHITVVIADDEKSIREGLKNSIAWEELNIEVIAVLSDGREALSSILELKPDICIIDICMPELTGLEVIKECKNKRSKTEFIILSGYSDFTYAQEAIHYGAKGYLLKPIHLNNFKNELYKLCDLIIEKKSLNINIDHLRKTSKIHLLNQLINNEIAQSNLDTLSLENFNIRNSLNRVIVCSLKHSDDSSHFEKDMITILEQTHFSVPCEIWSPKANQVVILINDNTKDLNLSYSIANRCLRKLESMSHCIFGIGIGDQVSSLSQMAYSYNRALLALSYQMYNQEPTIHDPSIICNTAPAMSPSNIDYYNLTLAILNADYEKMNHFCDSFFYALFYVPKPPPTFVKGMCIYLVINVLKDLNANVHTGYSFPLVSYEQLDRLITFTEFKKWILSFFHECCQISSEIAAGNPTHTKDQTIEMIKQYIHSNIKNNIKTKDIASYVNLSDSYCASYFKQKTGINLRDYILNHKMDYAKSRLLEDNVSIGEIAYELSYTDYRSFSRAFKNITGVSPSEYCSKPLPND